MNEELKQQGCECGNDCGCGNSESSCDCDGNCDCNEEGCGCGDACGCNSESSQGCGCGDSCGCNEESLEGCGCSSNDCECEGGCCCGGPNNPDIIILGEKEDPISKQLEEVIAISLQELELEADIRYINDPEVFQMNHLEKKPVLVIDGYMICQGEAIDRVSLQEALLRLGH